MIRGKVLDLSERFESLSLLLLLRGAVAERVNEGDPIEILARYIQRSEASRECVRITRS